jgi:hypothetical protein
MPALADVPTIEPEAIRRLSQQVYEWFRELNTKFNPPSPSGCRMIAQYVIVFGRASRRLQRQSLAVKHAKALLRLLEAEAENVRKQIDLMLSGMPVLKRLNERQELQSKLTGAHAAIRDLLPLLSSPPDPELDPIRHLAAIVREAVAETNEGQPFKSTNADDPLCQFLVKALEGRQNLSAEGISGILSGRRRANRRDGQKT